MFHKLELSFNLKDRVKVPKNKIVIIPTDDRYNMAAEKLIKNLKNNKKRDWLEKTSYGQRVRYCLPVTMINQMGFIIENPYDIDVLWDGGSCRESIKINQSEKINSEFSILESPFSNFGEGIVTFIMPWIIKTPKNINTLVLNPPNFYIDGITHMSACVETDNLRSNFALNFKITKINEWIHIPKGAPIGYLLPYPRYFIDNYDILLAEKYLNKKIIEEERLTNKLTAEERLNYDIKNNSKTGFRYIEGKDVYGNKFKNHQTSLQGKCPFR